MVVVQNHLKTRWPKHLVSSVEFQISTVSTTLVDTRDVSYLIFVGPFSTFLTVAVDMIVVVVVVTAIPVQDGSVLPVAAGLAGVAITLLFNLQVKKIICCRELNNL